QPPNFFGVVGLGYINMSGNSTNSYWAPAGYTVTSAHGSIASNGSITLSGSSLVQGDAQPGPGQVVNGASGRVTGSTTPLAAPLSYPNASAVTLLTNNDNALVQQISAGANDLKVGNNTTVTMPAGSYYLHDLNVETGGTLNITGPVTIYISHNMTLNG